MNKTTPLPPPPPRCQPGRRGTPLARLAIALLAATSTALPAADFADSAKYAWSENAGWLNLKATNGGAKVLSDHLEGYVWHENLGWIRLGSTGSGSPYYANTSKTNYGVNRDSTTGALSGYAWSENAGWINFASTGGGVYAAAVNGTPTGDLDGYAWSENAGWVRFAPYTVKGEVCGPDISYTTETWLMLALPCTPTSNSVAGAFGDGTPAKLTTAKYGVDGSGWFIYQRNIQTLAYDLLASDAAFTTGKGYWFWSYLSPDTGKLRLAGTATATTVTQAQGCASADGCVAVEVNTASASVSRYNLVANPFPYPLDWADVRIRVGGAGGTIYTPSEAAGAGSGKADPPVLDKQIWILNASGNSYDGFDDLPGTEGQLRYFTSFWVKVLPGAYGKTVELLIPARIKLSQAAPPSGEALANATALPWYLAWLDWLIAPAAAERSHRPGAGPEAVPARGWAIRPSSAPARTVSDPEFDLLVTQGIWSYGLSPKEAAREAHAQAKAEGREWTLRLTVDEPATGFQDHNNQLGQLLTAADGHDARDLIEMPPFATPYLTLVFPHPEWGDRAGDYVTDFRAASKMGRGREARLKSWTFEVRSDRPDSQVVLNWQGQPEVLKRSLLIDQGSGKRIRPSDRRYAGGYPVALGEKGARAFIWQYQP